MKRFVSADWSCRVAIAALAAAAGLVIAAPAGAGTVSITESTTASGSLGGQSFSDALVTFSGSGSTSSIAEVSPGLYFFDMPVEVTVAGVGSANFTDPMTFVTNQSVPWTGFGDLANNDVVLAVYPTSSGYDFSTSYGPVSGKGYFNSGLSFPTTGGGFVLDSVGTATYQAIVTGVPEPATWAMLILGAAMIGYALRRRREGAAVAA